MSKPKKIELEFAKKIAKLMEASPTSFNVIEENKKLLEENGYSELNESEKWNLVPGGKYYLTRNLSTIIAFQIPKSKNINGFMIAASHSDHPCFKIKHNPEIDVDGKYTVINTEPYAKPMYYTWMDRPLSVAGRILRKTKNGFKTEIVNADRPLFMIPSLSSHQADNVNKNGFKVESYNQVRPLFGEENVNLLNLITNKTDDIIDYDLYVVVSSKPEIWGANYEFLSARAIDDQVSAYSSLLALIESKPTKSIPVHMIFDNEEVGSNTKQGANSLILSNTLEHIAKTLGLEYNQMLPNSFIASVDNGHAFHPNYPESTDSTHKTYLGKGMLLKAASNFSYSTDGLSSAIVYSILKNTKIQIQEYYNKPSTSPGSTLARFISPKTTIASADLGVPQLSMHSGYETCSAKDALYLKEFIKEVFSSSIKMEKDGNYKLI